MRAFLSRTLPMILISISSPSIAQSSSTVVTTTPAQITKIFSEWGANEILVDVNTPFVNPASCPATDAYETDSTDLNSTLNQSMLLSAYMMHSQVSLAIQGCSSNNRPHIIGVSMPS